MQACFSRANLAEAFIWLHSLCRCALCIMNLPKRIDPSKAAQSWCYLQVLAGLSSDFIHSAGTRSPLNMPKDVAKNRSLRSSPTFRSRASPSIGPAASPTSENRKSSIGEMGDAMMSKVHDLLSSRMSSSTRSLDEKREAWRLVAKADFVSHDAWARVAHLSRLFPNLVSLPADLRSSTGKSKRNVPVDRREREREGLYR